MKIIHRFLSVVLAILILVSNVLSYGVLAETDSNTIDIYTAEDLIKLSKECSLDTYSKNMIVKLANDIDLFNKDFSPIPSFSGIFDGNNHTIKGLNIDSNGSVKGLFRYLEEDGVIKNLNVEGNINPSGSKEQLGGIVGINKGLILNSSFEGKVKGATSIGGIAGYNDKTGTIKDCQSSGIVIGNHYTGGIVGQNLGNVLGCTNNSKVNTTDSAIPDEDGILASLKNIDTSKFNSTENINAQTDSGGITGYNQGVIELSQNYGSIGYEHVGYNIGGIAGRQSGYISNCKNYGLINGRKDVGGIVGQIEPFINLLFSEDTLGRIDKELKVLNDLIENTVNEGESSTETFYNRLDNLNELTVSTSNKMEDLTNSATDYIDESTDVINTGINRVRRVMTQLEPVIGKFRKSSEEMTKGFKGLEKGFENLSKSSSSINRSFRDLDDALEDLNKASANANIAFNKMSKAVKLIENAGENSEEVDKAFEDLDSALVDLQLALEAGIEAFYNIAEILENIDTPGNIDWDSIGNELKSQLKIMLNHVNTAIPKMRNVFHILSQELKDDKELIREAILEVGDAIEFLEIFSTYISDTFEDMEYSINDLDSASRFATLGMKNISKGMLYFKNGLDDISVALTNVEFIFKEYNDYTNLELPNLNEYVSEESESLFEGMRSISSELSLLNEDVRNSSESFYDNFRLINNQFRVIVDIISDGLNSLSFEGEDLFEDISDESLNKEGTVNRGLIKNCYNEGTIFGDVNVGGIGGTMSIEYDFDPEDDIVKKGDKSLNFKYQTKALLVSSENKGDVQAKKDCVGGIIGNMDLGTIYKGENYGSIESLYGDYIGGVAGYSNSVIRKSYSLSELSGRDYIGGIAGYGTNIFDSFSLVQIDKSNEFIGAIAGDISGDFENNYFVKDRWEGIDGISYGNKAVPESYDEFILHEDLPKEFKSFQLTFVIEDEIIDTVPFEYGDSLDLNMLPDIPEKDGYYGSWPDYNYDKLVFSKKIEAIYTPLIKVLSSDKSEARPKLLVEGGFQPSDTLDIREINSSNLMIEDAPVIERWSIELGTEIDTPLTFRYFRPKSDKDILIYQRRGSKWEKLKTTEDGRYLLFESNLKKFDLAAVERDKDRTFYYILSIIILTIIIMLISKKIILKKKDKVSIKNI